MKTVTLSNHFYYSELNEQDAQAIKKDIVLYNRMLHKAYKMLSLKKEFGTNDYFPLSCIWKAQHLLKANIEHHQLWSNQKKQQLKRIEKKIAEKEKKINKLDQQISKLIEKTKAGKQTKQDYLKEVQVLKPERKRLKNQLSQLIFKKNRTLQLMNRKMNYCCFGGKKLARA